MDRVRCTVRSRITRKLRNEICKLRPPVVAKDAVSVGLLVKAKKLAAQFGSIEEAKAALNALAQLLD